MAMCIGIKMVKEFLVLIIDLLILYYWLWLSDRVGGFQLKYNNNQNLLEK